MEIWKRTKSVCINRTYILFSCKNEKVIRTFIRRGEKRNVWWWKNLRAKRDVYLFVFRLWIILLHWNLRSLLARIDENNVSASCNRSAMWYESRTLNLIKRISHIFKQQVKTSYRSILTFSVSFFFAKCKKSVILVLLLVEKKKTTKLTIWAQLFTFECMWQKFYTVWIIL